MDMMFHDATTEEVREVRGKQVLVACNERARGYSSRIEQLIVHAGVRERVGGKKERGEGIAV